MLLVSPEFWPRCSGHMRSRSDADKAGLSFHLASAEIVSNLQLAVQQEEDLVISASAYVTGSPNSSPAAENTRAASASPAAVVASTRRERSCDTMASVLIKRSTIGYDETVSALVAAIERRGLTVFARIDHAAGARDAGLELDSEDVVLFGSPRRGTPLMQSDRRVGVELPLRMLLWREQDQVMLGYRDPRKLAGTYDVAEHRDTLEQMAALLDQLAAEAAG